MGNVIAPVISFDDNSIIRWKGTPICTIKQAADFYNVPEGNIRKNYERNKERYREGEHVISLQGADLKDFGQIVQISFHQTVKKITLFTKRGMARLAKSCGSEQAWEVFEELEETYFNRSQTQDPALVLAHRLIAMNNENQKLIEQRDTALATKAQISAGREATMMSKLAKLATVDKLLDTIQRQNDDVKAVAAKSTKEIASDVRSILNFKKLPLDINKALVELGFQAPMEFTKRETKVKNRRVSFEQSYARTTVGMLHSIENMSLHIGRSNRVSITIYWKPSVIEHLVEFYQSAIASA